MFMYKIQEDKSSHEFLITGENSSQYSNQVYCYYLHLTREIRDMLLMLKDQAKEANRFYKIRKLEFENITVSDKFGMFFSLDQLREVTTEDSIGLEGVGLVQVTGTKDIPLYDFTEGTHIVEQTILFNDVGICFRCNDEYFPDLEICTPMIYWEQLEGIFNRVFPQSVEFLNSK